MAIDRETLASFEDDHGAPFARALECLVVELGEAPRSEDIVRLMRREAGDFGKVREEGGVAGAAPALRLLALDGLLTELLGDEASSA